MRGVHYSEVIMNFAPRDNDPPRGSFVSRNNDSKCRTREMGHLYLVITFLSIEPGRWGLFVSSNNDSKCRNMVHVDGVICLWHKGRRGSFDIRF